MWVFPDLFFLGELVGFGHHKNQGAVEKGGDFASEYLEFFAFVNTRLTEMPEKRWEEKTVQLKGGKATSSIT